MLVGQNWSPLKKLKMQQIKKMKGAKDEMISC